MQIAIGAALWAVAMAASAWLGLNWREWENGERITDVVVLFFVCGLIAYPLAIWPTSWLARRWSAERRCALAFLALATTTIGLTALAYAVQYRIYYSEWHDDHFTVRWVFEVGFTTLAAMYQFAVMGMPLYFPIGFIALAITALWFARRSN